MWFRNSFHHARARSGLRQGQAEETRNQRVLQPHEGGRAQISAAFPIGHGEPGIEALAVTIAPYQVDPKLIEWEDDHLSELKQAISEHSPKSIKHANVDKYTIQRPFRSSRFTSPAVVYIGHELVKYHVNNCMVERECLFPSMKVFKGLHIFPGF